MLAEDRFENLSAVRSSELFARPDGTFLVYVLMNYRGDWSDAYLDGAPPRVVRSGSRNCTTATRRWYHMREFKECDASELARAE